MDCGGKRSATPLWPEHVVSNRAPRQHSATSWQSSPTPKAVQFESRSASASAGLIKICVTPAMESGVSDHGVNTNYIVARIIFGFLGAIFLFPAIFYLFELTVSLQFPPAIVTVPTAFSVFFFVRWRYWTRLASRHRPSLDLEP
jgi:hypothetical protein